jgi:prophage antirepressor-like protein
VGGTQKFQCWNTEGIFRLIQSIPSPKAEPFKRWLARVGKEPQLKEQAAIADYLDAKEHASHLISSTIISEPEASKLAVFEGKQIRKTLHEGDWWFVIVDVVAVLTDSANPSGYLRDMRRRDPSLAEAFKGGRQIAPPLLWSLRRLAGPRSFSAGIPRASSVSSSPFPAPRRNHSSAGWLASARNGLMRLKTPNWPWPGCRNSTKRKANPRNGSTSGCGASRSGRI